jgi:hypothetical protein
MLQNERYKDVPRISETAQAIILRPDPNKDKSWHILFEDALADTNPASVLSSKKRGRRKATSIAGGGREVLISVKNAIGESKGDGIRYCQIEQRGYKIFKINGKSLIGDTIAERDSRFQKMMLEYPFGYEFTMEAAVANSGTTTLFATLIGEETLAGTLLREVYAETGLTVNIRPSLRKTTEDISDAWVRKAPKRETDGSGKRKIANWVYTFICDVGSMDIAEIEETDEARGRIWFNLLASLSIQLRELLKKRPQCNELPFFSQILNIVESLMNEGYSCIITKWIRDAMPDDHPLKNVPYGTMAYLVIDPERKRNRDAAEYSLVHPSWLMVLDYRGNLPIYHGQFEDQNEWERILRRMRDRGISSLSAEQKKALLEEFERELAKDDIPTMAPEAVETVVAVSEAITEEPTAEPIPDVVAASEKYDVAAGEAEQFDEAAKQRLSEEEYWAQFARPKILAEWKAGK